MDGLRRELADIRSTSFENLDIKNCAFFDVPDKMYEAKLLQAGDLLQKENQIFDFYVPKKTFKKKYYKKKCKITMCNYMACFCNNVRIYFVQI